MQNSGFFLYISLVRFRDANVSRSSETNVIAETQAVDLHISRIEGRDGAR